MTTPAWILDLTHSEVQFRIRHLMISTISGYFKQFNVFLKNENDDFSDVHIEFITDINSIDTNNAQRDAHLKSPDFFDAARHPQIKFESSHFEKIDAKNYKLQGVLTIRDISKQVTFNTVFGGITPDPWGNTRVGFTITGKINRQEFGIVFNAVTETGSVVLGDEVDVQCNIQFIRQKQ